MLTPSEIFTAPVEDLVSRASRQRVLDPTEEARLVGRAATDAEARAQLVRTYLRVAVDEAIRNRGLGLSQERLLRVAAVALIEAASEYEAERDGDFAVFAREAVRIGIDRAMAS